MPVACIYRADGFRPAVEGEAEIARLRAIVRRGARAGAGLRMSDRVVVIDYINPRGERSQRRILPLRI